MPGDQCCPPLDTETSWRSRGSVIPLFLEQLSQSKPLTVTDPNMTRFLMSLDESVDLVLHAFEHARAGRHLRAEGARVDDRRSRSGTARATSQRERDPDHWHAPRRKAVRVAASRARRWPVPRTSAATTAFPPTHAISTTTSTSSRVKRPISTADDYTSHNTQRLNVEEVKQVLRQLDIVREAIRCLRSRR